MKNAMKFFFMLLFVFFLANKGAFVFATENQIILVTQKSQDMPAGKFLLLVYSEAFRRLGMKFVYKQYPAKRASNMSDSGEADGELSRIYSYSEDHPNVIRVGEPHWTSGFIAIAADPTIHLDGWESLKGTDYMVDFRRGIKGCEVNLPKFVRPERLNMVSYASSGYKKVLAGWTDIFIGAEMDTIDLLKSDEFKNSDLRVVGVMERFTGHAFLHKKHKKLVPKVSDTLKEMKREGLFDKYREASKIVRYFKD